MINRVSEYDSSPSDQMVLWDRLPAEFRDRFLKLKDLPSGCRRLRGVYLVLEKSSLRKLVIKVNLIRPQEGIIYEHLPRGCPYISYPLEHHELPIREGQPFSTVLIFPYHPHEDLFEKLRTYRFTETILHRFFHQLLEAVEFLHQHRVVHLDLKAENILIDEDWNLKIADFDLAQIMPEERRTLWLDHRVGTLSCISPEVYRDKFATYATDIWGLGDIFATLVSEYAVRKSGKFIMFYQSLKKCPIRDPYTGHLDWNPEFLKLIEQMLALGWEKRPTPQQIKASPWYQQLYPVFGSTPVLAPVRERPTARSLSVGAPEIPEVPDLSTSPKVESWRASISD